MKHLYKIGIFATVLTTLYSCAESGLLDYNVEKPESIALQEELNTYDVLNKYVDYTLNPNFILGASLDLSTYTQKGLMYRLVNSNFNQLTFDKGMQHGDIVQTNGNLLMTNLNNALGLVKESGLTVFGSSLVWNKNQNSTYLNSLLGPLTAVIKPYNNFLNKVSLGSNSLSGWTINSSTGASAAVVDGKGLNGGKAIRLISGLTSSAATDIQLITPNIPIVQGHQYEVIMYVRSEVAGEARISFSGLENNTPNLDWSGTGVATPTFSTSFIWKQLKFIIKDFTSNTINLHLDFGYKPNVTYYIDTPTFYVRDMADSGDSGGGNNTIVTGNKLFFEAECGNIVSGGKFKIYTNDTNASEGKYIMVQPAANLTNTSLITPSDCVTYDFNVNSSGSFRLWARLGALANTGTDDSFHFRIDNGPWLTWNAQMNQLGLKWYSIMSSNLEPGSTHKITVAYREDGGKLDKLYLTNAGDTPSENNSLGVAGNCGGVVIVANKSAEEKSFIVNAELEKWISGVVSNSKEVVKAWNVLNEPMDDVNPTQVKSGAGVSDATQFFWQDYLGGKDYGLKAFKIAKENANPTDLLFISDYGLEKNLNKCNGLIQYVQYLESNGAHVDGIATKLNLNLSSDKDKIFTMFELLAATGKKIAITDLYVNVMNKTATPEMLQLQSEMYRYVVESYAQIVPVSQRYGITLKGIQDTSTDAQGLWDSTLSIYRKPAYAGFAEGLKSLK